VSAPDNTLKHPSEAAAIGAQVAKAVAWVSGLFSLVACIFLIMQQIQSMTVDPLNDPTLKAMKAQITKDQNNQQLRDSVRALHLMTRKAFFTNQTLMRATGLMTLFGVAVFLASMKTYVELRLKLPVPKGQAPREGGTVERAAGRWAVAAGAGLIVLATLLMVFLSPPEFDLVGPKPAEGSAEAKPAAPSTPANPETAALTPLKSEEPKAPLPETGVKPPAEAPAKVEPLPAHAWPSFRGPDGSGIAARPKAPLTWNGQTGDNITWKVPIPKTGTNSPVVWGDRVFVAGADEQTRDVYAFDAKTGKLLWTGSTGLISGTLPKIMDGTTYAPATLATDGDRVYAVFATGDLVAWNMDGSKAWGRHLGTFKNSYGHSSSLMLHAGRVLVQFDHEAGGHFLGFDGKTGKTLFDQARDVKQSSWASPIVVNTGSRTEAILSAKPLVISHDPATGKILWKVECMDGEVAPSAAYAAGRVFLANEGAAALAIQLGPEPKILWKYEEGLPDVASPVATEKYVLMAASSGMVTCLDAATGKKIWSQEFDDGFYSSPIIAGDRVYLMDKRGVTVVFKLGDQYEKLSLNPLGEKATCTPAFSEGRIYFRSEKNLYCVGKD
jgi:outer membrane protein assembly factor BamB